MVQDVDFRVWASGLRFGGVVGCHGFGFGVVSLKLDVRIWKSRTFLGQYSHCFQTSARAETSRHTT